MWEVVQNWIKIFDQERSKGGHFILTCKEEEIRLILDWGWCKVIRTKEGVQNWDTDLEKWRCCLWPAWSHGHKHKRPSVNKLSNSAFLLITLGMTVCVLRMNKICMCTIINAVLFASTLWGQECYTFVILIFLHLGVIYFLAYTYYH